ncbi:MAG: hypothetical protein PVI70_10600 [Gammaproteobacteria bacterium]|jgi:hypothetical protein
MFLEIPRLLSAIITMALLAWHSGTYVRRFGLEAGKKVFYLRYTARFKTPDGEIRDTMRRRTGSLSLK